MKRGLKEDFFQVFDTRQIARCSFSLNEKRIESSLYILPRRGHNDLCLNEKRIESLGRGDWEGV